MKFVSVIIPVLNEEEFLKERLTALQWLRNKYSEIIIVDGGSSDHSAKISAPMADTFLFSRKGRANQMNAGAKNARGEILLFLHSDAVFLENSFEELQKKIATIDIFWGWFNLKFTDRSLIFSLISNSMRIRSSLTKICTGDQTLFVSAKLFNDIGGFPDIPLMEDIAISKMLKKESPPVFISNPVFSSVRRWESEGALKTILTMWWLRFQYWASIDPKRLAKSYYPQIDFSINDTNKNHQSFKFPQINILLFARTPELGKVKTRLEPALGAEKALSLHKAMINRIFQLASKSGLAESKLWLTSGDNKEMFIKLSSGDSVFNQPEGNLGEKMLFAIAQTLNLPNMNAAIVVGCDCPSINKDYLNTALLHLDQGVKLVLGPAEDGGYVLIGMNAVYPEIFEGISWGSTEVFSQTVKNAEALGISYVSLDPLWDVDRPEDLPRLEELVPPLDW